MRATRCESQSLHCPQTADHPWRSVSMTAGVIVSGTAGLVGGQFRAARRKVRNGLLPERLKTNTFSRLHFRRWTCRCVRRGIGQGPSAGSCAAKKARQRRVTGLWRRSRQPRAARRPTPCRHSRWPVSLGDYALCVATRAFPASIAHLALVIPKAISVYLASPVALDALAFAIALWTGRPGSHGCPLDEVARPANSLPECHQAPKRREVLRQRDRQRVQVMRVATGEIDDTHPQRCTCMRKGRNGSRDAPSRQSQVRDRRNGGNRAAEEVR